MSPSRNRFLPMLLVLGWATLGRADESLSPATGTLGSSTFSGYVDTSSTFPAVSAVPEPGTLALAAVGAALLVAAGRRARRR